jgi:hypothetical protein
MRFTITPHTNGFGAPNFLAKGLFPQLLQSWIRDAGRPPITAFRNQPTAAVLIRMYAAAGMVIGILLAIFVWAAFTLAI